MVDRRSRGRPAVARPRLGAGHPATTTRWRRRRALRRLVDPPASADPLNTSGAFAGLRAPPSAGRHAPPPLFSRGPVPARRPLGHFARTLPRRSRPAAPRSRQGRRSPSTNPRRRGRPGLRQRTLADACAKTMPCAQPARRIQRQSGRWRQPAGRPPRAPALGGACNPRPAARGQRPGGARPPPLSLPSVSIALANSAASPFAYLARPILMR